MGISLYYFYTLMCMFSPFLLFQCLHPMQLDAPEDRVVLLKDLHSAKPEVIREVKGPRTENLSSEVNRVLQRSLITFPGRALRPTNALYIVFLVVRRWPCPTQTCPFSPSACSACHPPARRSRAISACSSPPTLSASSRW